ncbi:transcription factor IIA, alpha/beta subunit-domain-containing protein [Mycena galopus ATCC 62051]|nr:transcription factor IIA, alpha/beta subunit-domain-containing protein [Mycena galopus ATCC 62051]
MSNKIVPSIYRAVIDDVMASIRPAFEEFGVDDDVLNELQSKWENKVIASRVADFDPAPPASVPSQRPITYPHPTLPALPHPTMPNGNSYGISYVPPSAAQPRANAKAEPRADARAYAAQYAGAAGYAPPSLPGPSLSGPSFPSLPSLSGPSFPSLGGNGNANGNGSGYSLAFPGNGAGLYRMPQTDGPSGYDEDDEDEDDLEDVGPMPRTAHPSLPQPLPPPARAPTAPAKAGAGAGSSKGKAAAAPKGKTGPGARAPTDPEYDPEAINSDLDDSDTENEDDAANGGEEGGVETDIVFCTYDKVQRVKNKWKCVLKDGMIHTGGRDYLFQRCTGEFEW